MTPDDGTPVTRKRTSARIRGVPVPMLAPAQGAVRVLCIGEAPGPRGADKSGVPFFGDRAGQPLYRALVAAGACELPREVDALPWDGAAFAARGLAPALHGVALGNAFDRCPTSDGVRFRAPSRAELTGADNRARLVHDVESLRDRGLARVLTLGRVATQTMQELFDEEGTRFAAIELVSVPHPSAQGLLAAAPGRGKGARLADLAAAWERGVSALVREALGGHDVGTDAPEAT